MAQYLNFTSDFSVDALWPLRGSCSLSDTTESSPGGGNWYEIDTTAVSSWLNQDRKDGSDVLGGKRLQANVRVRAGLGSQADLICTLYNVNTSLGEIRLLADLTAGTASITSDSTGLVATEANLSQSIFITEEVTGEYRVGFSFNSPAETTRVIFKLHTTRSFSSAQYSDANLIDSTGDGLEPFSFFTVEPKLTPTRWTEPFSNPLNPDIATETPEGANAWDVRKESVTFDTVTQVATPDELVAAISTAELSTAQNHPIEVTTDDWIGQSVGSYGDIRLQGDVDFVAAGGSVFIDTASGNKLVTDTRVQILGDSRGIAWYNLKSLYFNDQYNDPKGRGGLNKSCLYTSNGTFVFDGLEAGLGDTDDFTMMKSATAVTLNSSRTNDSVVFRNCKIRGALNSIRASGAMTIVRDNCYFDLEFEDSCYGRMNGGAVPAGSDMTFITKNVFNGPPANENIYLICCNTRESEWTVPGEIYPYEVGQIVQQESGFQGVIEAIYLGDGETVAPHSGNCRTIAGTEGVYGWRGDLVFIRATSPRYKFMIAGESLVSESASYTPQFLVTNGAPYGMDGGVLLGFLHTDGLQYGTTLDQPNTTYNLYTAGWFSVMTAPFAGAIQQFIHNETATVRQRHWTRVAYLNGTATRAHPINHTDTVIENLICGLAPVGDNHERALADPAASFQGAGAVPQINVNTTLDLLDRGDYDHKIGNTISSRNSNPQEDGFDYPWLGNVTVADPYQPPESETSYETVFGRTRSRAVYDGCVIEKPPFVPFNGTLAQCQSVVANWLDWYRTPVALGGWDLTTDQSGNGFAHPLIYGRDYNPGRVPIIQFSEWPHRVIEQGGSWSLPAFTATDGVDDLTGSVVVTEGIDTNTLGCQWVKYDVVNSDGNSVTTYSVVEVVQPSLRASTINQGSNTMLGFKVSKSGVETLNSDVSDSENATQSGLTIIGGSQEDWAEYKKVGNNWVNINDDEDIVIVNQAE